MQLRVRGSLPELASSAGGRLEGPQQDQALLRQWPAPGSELRWQEPRAGWLLVLRGLAAPSGERAAALTWQDLATGAK